MKRYSELNENARDILAELGNIGTGNAVTSLSQMLNRTIEMERPDVRILEFNEVPEVLGGAEEVRFSVLLELNGEISGMFMFLISSEFMQVMLEELLGEDVPDLKALPPDSMEWSAVGEIGNIMCCSYLNALTKMMDVSVGVSVPRTCVDMIGAILSVPMIHFAGSNDELLLIENQYHFGDTSVISHVLFLPEMDSLEHMFQILGEEYES